MDLYVSKRKKERKKIRKKERKKEKEKTDIYVKERMNGYMSK